VRQTADGGYIVTGFEGAAASFDGLKVYLLKTDANGNRESDLKPRDGYGHSLVVLADGSIIVTGGSGDQAYLAKLGSGVQPPDNKRYTYSFGTSPMFEFVAPIDWQGKSAGKIGVNNQTITINGLLKFSGTIELDTTRASATDNIRFTASGRFFLADAPLPKSGRGELTLFNGTISNGRVGSRGIELITVAQEPTGVRLFGTDLHPTQFQSVGGVAATGFRLAGWLTLPEASSCRNPADPQIAFTDLEVSGSDIKLYYLEALSYGPIFCMDQPSATYDRASDALVINGWMRSSAMFPEQIRALTGISGGHLLPTFLAPGNNPEVKFGSAYIPPVIRDFTGAMAFFPVPLFDVILGPFTTVMGTIVAPGGFYEADIPQGLLVYVGAAPKGPVSDLRMIKLGDDFFHIVGTPDLTLGSGGIFVVSMFEGAMKAGKRTNGSYVIDGEGQLNVLHAGTGAGVNGTITGTFTMPMSSPDPFLAAMGMFTYRLGPGQTLANHTVTIKGTSTGTKALYTTVPPALPFADPIAVKIDLSKKESDEEFFSPHFDVQKVLKKTARKSDDRSLQSAVDRLDTFEVDDAMEQVYFRIWSQGSLAGTYLISPSGERIEATKGDSSIIRTVASGQQEFWGLYLPAPGKWQIGIQDAAPSDSVMVMAINKRRPFALSASQQGRDLTASWSTEGARAGSTVSLYLDSDTSGLDGMLIGQVAESAGTFNYTLSDTLSECSYYLHAIRDDNSRIDADYAPQSFNNAKSGLAAPGGITALYSQSNKGVVMTWTRPSDPAVVGYLVRVIDASGNDSIYAMPYAHQTTTAFIVENVAGKTVSMASYDSLGHRGCWSPEQLMVPASVRDAVTGVQAQIAMSIVPNPVRADAHVNFTLRKRSDVNLTLFDNLGRTVSSAASATFDAGRHQMTIEVSHLPTGTYSLLLQAGDEIGSETIVVVH
jgi:hypothetical protein